MGLTDTDLEEISDEQAEEIVFGGVFETVSESECAIVLGTDPRYALVRAQIAASFYRKTAVKIMLCSGGAVWDESITEAAFLRMQLERLGVPPNRIFEEPIARDTKQNMTCSLALLSRLTDIAQIRTVTIITEPFHMRRSLCLANLLLPSYFSISGYTEGTAAQRMSWKEDVRLRACVKEELRNMCRLIRQGRMRDIELKNI